jgi:hypothetical protein
MTLELLSYGRGDKQRFSGDIRNKLKRLCVKRGKVEVP